MENAYLNKNERVFGLDLIRACAIVFVLLGHSYKYLKPALAKTLSIFIFDGVHLFFVLSGFLIGNIILSTFAKTNTWETLFVFWIRRWLKTLPAYFTVLSILVLLSYFFTNAISLDESVKYFTFTQNIYGQYIGFFSESWSLSVEEWFYLIFPIMLVIGTRILKLNFSFIVFSIFLAVYSLFMRHTAYYEFYNQQIILKDMYLNKQVITQLNVLAIGLLFSLINCKIEVKKSILLILFIGSVLILFLIKYLVRYDLNYFNYVLSPIFNGICFGNIILFCSTIKYRHFNIFKSAIEKISILSYCIYLVNLTIVQDTVMLILERYHILSVANSSTNWLSLLSYWALSLFGAYSLHYFIERPFIMLRDKHFNLK